MNKAKAWEFQRTCCHMFAVDLSFLPFFGVHFFATLLGLLCTSWVRFLVVLMEFDETSAMFKLFSGCGAEKKYLLLSAIEK